MIIYVDTAFDKEQEDLLIKRFPEDVFIFRKQLADISEQQSAILSAEVISGNPRQLDWLEAAEHLKWVQLYSTGFEYFKPLRSKAIFTNMQDYYSEPCAETILAGLLALFRGMDRFTLLKEKKEWVGHNIRTSLGLLENKKVIILGAGNIGRRMAKLLSGFDCEIKFYARTAVDAVIRNVEELEAAIPLTDIIIGCLPGTPETMGFFTNRMLSRMHSKAIFCNVGRGNLLEDEKHLVHYVNEKRIGGAVLDVTASEPIPENDPLWNCENVILSQHSGGGNTEEFDGIARFFIENLERFKNGQPLKNVVELDRGY